MIGLYVGTSVVKCLKFQEAILINNHAIKENYTLGNPPDILIYIILIIIQAFLISVLAQQT